VYLGDRCHPFALRHLVAWQLVAEDGGGCATDASVVEEGAERSADVVQSPGADAVVGAPIQLSRQNFKPLRGDGFSCC
jgi:hypothetical protein